MDAWHRESLRPDVLRTRRYRGHRTGRAIQCGESDFGADREADIPQRLKSGCAGLAAQAGRRYQSARAYSDCASHSR